MPATAPAAAWPDSLAAAASYAVAHGRRSRREARAFPLPVPFEDALRPLCAWASGEARRLGARSTSLEDDAWDDLERALAVILATIASGALLAEFDRVRPPGRSLLARFLHEEAIVRADAPAHSRSRYDAFVDALLDDGFAHFFETYPVLARLAGVALDAWIARTVELLERLHADRARLADAFALGPDEVVTRIDAGLSDPHDEGRSVAILTFESGVRLAYKPRSIALDAAFGEALAWCNARARFLPPGDEEPVRFAVPRSLACGTHGWVEAIAPAPCASERARERADFAGGMLLAAAYLLGMTDGHGENVVADGERLVLVDAETVLHPHVATQPGRREYQLGRTRGWDTVLRTGLLPQWQALPDGRGIVDMSGLATAAAVRGTIVGGRWHALNTDEMSFGIERRADVPDADADQPDATDERRVDRIVAGFEAVYRFAAEHREALIAGPLAAFAGLRARFVARGTSEYAALLIESVQPARLRDETAYGEALMQLGPAWSDDAGEKLLHAELRALRRLDVPYFEVDVDGATIADRTAFSVSPPAVTRGLQDATERLRELSDDDAERQCALVRAAFAARRARLVDPGPATPWPHDGTSSEASLLEAARRIADDLAATALSADGDAVEWITLSYQNENACYAVARSGFDLYDGGTGIALFLGTFAALTGERRFEQLARRAIAPVRIALRDDPQALARNGIGGGFGAGSVVYALVRLAHALDDPSLLADARAAASLISDEAIAADRRYDVLDGAAGAVLALLALAAAGGVDAVLARAAVAARHLVASRSGEADRRTWLVDGRRLTGCAHGAAGIAMAVQRAAAALHDETFAAAAREALAYERATFLPADGNWPDFRHAPDDQGRLRSSMMWCHGAPGIGLARLASGALDATAAEEVEIALRSTLAHGLGSADHLCCGNFGRIEFVHEVARSRGDRALAHRAQAAANAVLERAHRGGAFGLGFDDAPARWKPSLFRGSAGIGYALLRLVAPDDVPSVLAWR